MKNIEKYEKTVMLSLSDEERDVLSKRFDEITKSFRVLDEYDVVGQGLGIRDQGLVACNIMREDVVEKHFTRKELLKDGEYFSVPIS